ncbi:hypothetical protein [Pseudonocardia sp. H11422]|uniref:hypothetical protein n=1 Tax=Pseudonocardia sp. H11422 TaxID=2835866 RepID=UPI001BDD677F|nr:hypothetical protein [Pseudonocardia sp. H11422]
MSSETDQPRQRTVAELLAENGGSGSTGRRRRRRETDGPDDAAQSADRPAPGGPPPAPPPDRHAPSVPSAPAGRWPAPPGPARVAGYRGAQGLEPPGRGSEPPRGGAPNGAGSNGAARNGAVPNGTAANGVGYGGPPVGGGPRQRSAWSPDPAPLPERPTEQMPRIREDRPAPGGAAIDDATGPIERYTGEATTAVRPHISEATTALRPKSGSAAPRDAPDRGDADGGPPTMLGAPPLSDDEDQDRADAPAHPRSPEPPAFRRAETSFDGGPPTQAARLDDLDEYDGDYDDHPAGLAGDDRGVDHHDDLDDGSADKAQRRLGRGTAMRESPGSAWAAVVAQWIAGAVTGAALWVGFRYLWFNLPVVALAAAVLVTVALVLGVRAMLRNDDLRTTIFAVLVGLLLTVSPALLVLLGR